LAPLFGGSGAPDPSISFMKWKTTLILLAIVVAFGAYIKFVEPNRPDTAEAQRRAQNILNFNREKINGIVIWNGDDKIEVRKIDNKWRLESPIKDQADNSLIDNLLMSLESWQKDATIPAKEMAADKNKLSEFGLDKAKLRLGLTGEGAPPAILFGKDTALEGKMYVRFESSNETFLAAQSIKKEIEKKAEEFRDRKLTDLITAKVSRVVLKTPAGEMELEKKGDHWEIMKPLRARGDDQKVGDLIAQVTTARIQQFVADDHGDLHPYGLAEPRGTITLFGQDDKQGQMLQIGGVSDKEKDQVYVRSAARGFVYTLPKKIEQTLNTKPNDVRDRHLVRFDTNILDRITIEPAGKDKTVLARKGEEWTIVSRNNPPANSGEALRLIDMLKNEQITKFVEDVASNLPKYGLDKPQLQITLSSFASGNTAETKAGEQPIATISFGKIDGDNVYARLGDEPFIVAARRKLLDEIHVDPLQWQDLSIFKFKPEQIHRLSVTTNGEQALVRGANNEWTWTKGSEPINQVNLQSLLNTLSNLHAVRWIGPTVAQHGFDKPQIAITFTTSPDDKASHKLTVGAPIGDGMWFGKVDEREGTFVVNNPDFNALRLPLVGQPPPPPSPSASASAAQAVSPVAKP
jgi:hypothetical protein